MSTRPHKTYITVAVTPSTAYANNPHDDWTIHVNGYFVADVRGKRMAGEVVEGITRRYVGKDDLDEYQQAKIEMKVVLELEEEGTYHRTLTDGKGEYPIEMQECPYGRNLIDTIRETIT